MDSTLLARRRGLRNKGRCESARRVAGALSVEKEGEFCKKATRFLWFIFRGAAAFSSRTSTDGAFTCRRGTPTYDVRSKNNDTVFARLCMHQIRTVRLFHIKNIAPTYDVRLKNNETVFVQLRIRGLFKKYREFWISAGYVYSIFCDVILVLISLSYGDKFGHFQCSVNFWHLFYLNVFWLVFDFYLFSFGNKKKTQGAKSGEYGGCGNIIVSLLAKNSRTSNDVWAGALSWCKSQFCSSTNSGVSGGLLRANCA